MSPSNVRRLMQRLEATDEAGSSHARLVDASLFRELMATLHEALELERTWRSVNGRSETPAEYADRIARGGR